jgi:DNA-binding MarR family transcriptional regulator
MSRSPEAVTGLTATRKKWGEYATEGGFTIIPNHLLAINQFVTEDKRITPTEMVVLFQLLLTWWSPDRLPFPSKATIGRRTGLSPRQVQRALGGLEAKGYLSRIARFVENRGRISNVYQLGPLTAVIERIARENPKIFRQKSKEVAE